MCAYTGKPLRDGIRWMGKRKMKASDRGMEFGISDGEGLG